MSALLSLILISASAAIVLVLGTLHLVYTFTTPKFDPRDAALAEQMRRISPVISKQTTMWRAWVGFNASHSLGAMLFGVMYLYFAIAHGDLLLHSPFRFVVGAAFLGSFVVLAKRYWFSIPFAGVVASLTSDTSTGPTSAGVATARAGWTRTSPSTLATLRPCERIATRCSPRATNVTSTPASARRAPK